jgi:hypothetical protein
VSEGVRVAVLLLDRQLRDRDTHTRICVCAAEGLNFLFKKVVRRTHIARRER